MFSLKIFLLVGVAFQAPIEVVSHNKNNFPSDHYSLTAGINVYPPRPLRPAKNSNMPSFASSLYQEHSCPYVQNDANALVSSISKMVNSFYSNNYHKIDMGSDAGIGLGVLKGQLNYLLDKREDKFSSKLKQSLEQLQMSSGKLALKVLDQSISAATDADKKFGAQVIRNNTNVLQARFRDWNDMDKISSRFFEFKNIGEEKEVIYPYLDFHCLVTMVKDCTIPQVCSKMYLTDIYSQYMLTHQIMYQQFAERRSCITVNQQAFGNAQEFRDRLCAKAYLEAQFLENHNFPTRYVDLFAEEVGFCGLLGYPNFMKADWLREILSWQTSSKSGCVVDFYGDNQTTDVVVFADVNGEDGKNFQEPCLVHLTSVTLMAISINLRYMVDVCPPNIFD